MTKKNRRLDDEIKDDVLHWIGNARHREAYEKCRRRPKRRKDEECEIPRIPLFKGRKVKEFISAYTTLMDAENALDARAYPLPPIAVRRIQEVCGDEESVRDVTKCVGNWVHRNISYNVHHSTQSLAAAHAIRVNADKEKFRDDNRDNTAYPMHRYMTSFEAWEAQTGICGELSQIVVGLLRSLKIPAALYRPHESHFAAIAEDAEKGEFYVYDATNPSNNCVYHGSAEYPAAVTTRRWSPESAYTFGVTPHEDFLAWNLIRRQYLGTAKACQLLAGTHDEEGRRKGYFLNENGELDLEKLERFEPTKREVKEVNKLFKECGKYLDFVYETSNYHDISYDTENILRHPPRGRLVRSFGGADIIDLEHAAECREPPYRTLFGDMVEAALEEECEIRRSYLEELEEADGKKWRYWEDWAEWRAHKTGQEEALRMPESCSLEFGDLNDEDIEEDALWEDEEDEDERREREFLEKGYVSEDDEEEWGFLK